MKKRGTVLFIIGLILIAAGIALACFNLVTDARAGAAGKTITKHLMQQIPPTVPALDDLPQSFDMPEEVEYPDYLLDPMRDMPTVELDGIAYVGLVRIPSQELELPVLAECTADNLKVAPCRFSGSVYLDNMVICAHNYSSHFGKMINLRIGDAVTFTDVEGNVFCYSVLELETVQPDQQEYMQTGDWDLTLFTCTWGGASRVTVRCERVPNE